MIFFSEKKENGLFALFTGLFILVILLAFLSDLLWLIAIPLAALFLYAGWQNRDTVFFLLLLTLPLSFEYNFSPTLGTDIPDESLMLLTCFFFFAYWLYTPQSVSGKAWAHPLFFLLLGMLGWMLVTVIFSTDSFVSIKFLLAKAWYVGAFVLAPLIVFRNKERIVMAAKLIICSMLLVTIIALIRHSNNSFSFATINESVSPFFRNHVNYSAMLVCIVPVLIAFWKLTKTATLKWLFAVAIMISLSALFFSYARGAWLALINGIITYWLIEKKVLAFAYVVFIITAIATVFWLKSNDRYLRYAHDYQTTIFHKNFSEHLVATYKLKDVSTAERFYRWIAGVRMIKDKPLTGYGPNTFYDNYKPYAVPAYKTWVSDNKEHSTIHNYFLLTVIEQGYPGLVFLVLFLGAMLYYAQFLFHRIKDEFYRTTALTIGVIIVMIITVNLLSDLVETDKIGSLFFLCLSILIMTDINTRSDSPPDIQRIS
ncbi:MAG TPA: O-antigen ligase family protein [Chitinophagaceae bacterium]|nr:O-antigen ligase family protein [Chitinophagaceae bacterium]